MVTKVYETLVDAPVQKVWEFHSDVRSMRLITPPEDHLELVSRDMSVHDGALHEFRIKKFGRHFTWRARISAVDPPHTFTDTAERSPFRYWKHVHEFIEDPMGTIIKDTVTYRPPGWLLSGMVNSLVVEEALDKFFKYRHRATHEFLEDSQKAVINEDIVGKASDHYEPHVT
ncbi:MAG: SRPBCC family protein [Fimbriimonadaceae bacterium]|nr:SRPBCC family protein [Fimbriimonadaceae bacterium]